MAKKAKKRSTIHIGCLFIGLIAQFLFLSTMGFFGLLWIPFWIAMWIKCLDNVEDN